MSLPDPDAPAVLTIDQRGVVTLEIADHEGRVIGYLLEPDPGAAGWGVILRRLDGEGGPYHVGRRPGRLFGCDCPDARYRARREARSCKHVLSVRALLRMIVRLTTTPTPQEYPREQE